MKRLANVGAVIVLVHTVLSALYYYSHERIDPTWSFAGHGVVIGIFVAAPCLAVVLLYTLYQRQGAVLFLGTFLAALLFVGYMRIFEKSHHVDFSVLPREWYFVYQGTFILLLATQFIGSWVGYKMLQEVHATQSEPQP